MIELKLGDCINELKNIPDKSIDLVVMDPPYGLNTNSCRPQGGGCFGNKNRDYLNQLSELYSGYDFSTVLDELVRVMKKINIYIWCNKEQVPIYLNYFSDYHFDILTWHKSNPVPTCDNKYLSDTEYLLFFRETGVKIYGDYETKKKYYITPINKEDKALYNHPTVKPQFIIENLIINSSKEDELVLDPFMGSGTTGAACKKLNRNFIGIEIDKNYYNTAVNRINNEGSFTFENPKEVERINLW